MPWKSDSATPYVFSTKTKEPGAKPTAGSEYDRSPNYDNGNRNKDSAAEPSISIMDVTPINVTQPFGPKRTVHVSHKDSEREFSTSATTSSAAETTSAPKEVYSSTGDKVNPDGSYDFGNEDEKLDSCKMVKYVTATVWE